MVLTSLPKMECEVPRSSCILRRAGMGMLAHPNGPRTGVESVDSRPFELRPGQALEKAKDRASEILNVERRSKAKDRLPAERRWAGMFTSKSARLSGA